MACAKIILDVKPTPTGTLETYHLQFEQTDNSAFYVEFNKSSIHSDAKKLEHWSTTVAFTYPTCILSLPLGVNRLEVQCSLTCIIGCLLIVVLTQYVYQHVTDRRTDGLTDKHNCYSCCALSA